MRQSVNELFHTLPAGALVLDLGCAQGSIRAPDPQFTIVRIDLDAPRSSLVNFARSDAARLPFRSQTFDLIVSNHSLEHFENLPAALREVSRVMKPEGALYVSVPDATTFCDRLYRWLARGGGHVNAFTSATELAARIQQATGLPHVATRTLCTSLSFLNRHNRTARAPRKLWLFGGGTEASLRLISWFSRLSDGLFHTRMSVYGWALYFGSAQPPVDIRPWTNVCIRCGSGHPSGWLLSQVKLVRRRFLLPTYTCPTCGTWNLFSRDEIMN